MHILRITGDFLERLWPVLRECFSHAHKKGGSSWEPEKTFTEIIEGKAHCLYAVDGKREAVFIISVRKNDTMGGDIISNSEAWIDCLFGEGVVSMIGNITDFMEEYAIWNGCGRCVFEGRKGWQKVTGKYGWKFTGKQFERMVRL